MGKHTLHNLPRLQGQFIDREVVTKRILEKLSSESRTWLIAICGMGGVGKTTLALNVAKTLARQGEFDAIVWASSKSHKLTKKGLEQISTDELLITLDDLLNSIANVLDINIDAEKHLAKHKIIQAHLANKRVLLVVDNLETVEDNDAAQILWFLRDLLPNPSKAIITSRYLLAGEGEVSIELESFTLESAIELIKSERKLEKYFNLNKLSRDSIRIIFEKTSGNPLAMKWILGQLGIRNEIKDIINKLGEKKDEPFLDYCFQQSFLKLKPASRDLLKCMSVLNYPAETYYIKQICKLGDDQFERSLKELIVKFLVDEDEGKERITLLPLTQIYARKQLAKDVQLEEKILMRLENSVNSE